MFIWLATKRWSRVLLSYYVSVTYTIEIPRTLRILLTILFPSIFRQTLVHRDKEETDRQRGRNRDRQTKGETERNIERQI